MPSETITPQQLKDRINKGESFDVIDVRTPVEYQEVHLTFARNVPLDRLNATAIATEHNAKEQPVYVVCRSGGRGKQACDQLVAAGCHRVINIEGGTLSCVEAGLPVVRGKKAISLERQVRIAAGSLVLLGVVLGTAIHPYWLGLAGFVGAGLVFAGVTDTCGMGMMLARMPWNQVRQTTSCQA